MNFKSAIFQTADFFEKVLRFCSNCGHFSMPNRALCKICYESLKKYKNSNWVNGYRHSTISIWEWGHQNEDFVRRYLHSIKGGGPKYLFNQFAEDLLHIRNNMTHQTVIDKPYFIPAPGANEFVEDHAERLASSCASMFGENSFAVLARSKQLHQKRKSRKDRLSELDDALTLISELDFQRRDLDRPLVFIDDIITSGGTANSAFRILGSPKNFEVWTIFHRPRLL
ncbi:MAG: hypothetical protein ABL927_12525 [Bdellovibrionales bacterium]